MSSAGFPIWILNDIRPMTTWNFLTLAALALGFGLGAQQSVAQDSIPASEIPDILGLVRSRAGAVLQEAGIPYQVHEVESSMRLGTVSSTFPEGGKCGFLSMNDLDRLLCPSISSERPLLVTISKGRWVPDVTGLAVDEALQQLDYYTIPWATTTLPIPGVEPGLVGHQIPPGEQLMDVSINVAYISVSNDIGVQLPNLAGRAVPQAVAELQQRGVVGSHQPYPGPTEVIRWSQAPGDGVAFTSCDRWRQTTVATVDRTDPPAGSWVLDGATVTIHFTTRIEETYLGWINDRTKETCK